MLKGFGADLTGSADICKCIPANEINAEPFADMALGGEVIYIYLRSKKENHFFTNKAYYCAMGESAAGTKRLVERKSYYSDILRDVKFETSGVGITDRDCELKFVIGAKSVSIDVWKAQDPTVRVYYKILTEIASLQVKNATKLQYVKEAMTGRGIDKLQLQDGSQAASVFSAMASEARNWGLYLAETFHQDDFTECFTKYLGGGQYPSAPVLAIAIEGGK